MTPHKQRNLHKPDQGVWGDCCRTVIACLLDLEPEDVPHFGDPSVCPLDRWPAMRDEWLMRHGFALARVLFDGSVGLDALLLNMHYTNPDLYYMLSGMSASGVDHVVVGLGGEIIHDPARNDSGIVGPGSDGYFWVEFLVPLAMKARPR